MARPRKFKTDLPRNTPLWNGPSPYHEGYRQILMVENPKARTSGTYVPTQFEFIVPILVKMGFKVEERTTRWRDQYNTNWYVIGLTTHHPSDVQYERYPDRYHTPENVMTYISDNSKNQTFKLLLKRPSPSFSMEVIEFMKAPVTVDENDTAWYDHESVDVE